MPRRTRADEGVHGEAPSTPRGGSGAPGLGSLGPGINRRARRGDVRSAILVLLQESPMHGYQIMQELEGRSGGAWHPSPGSVYPALSLLESQGLVAGEECEGRRVFSLTRQGADKAREQEPAPWARFAGPHGDRMGPIRDSLDGVISVAKLVGHTGDEAQAARAVEILNEARSRLYRILADAE